MTLICRRICHLPGVNNENLNNIIDEIQQSINQVKLPENSFVDVYKDVTTCCGDLSIGVAVEIQTSGKSSLDELNQRLTTKFREICSRNNIENHCDSDLTSCDPVEI